MKYDNCKDCKSRCEHAGKDREFVCIKGVSCKVVKPMTNYERIKAMSVDEMAEMLSEVTDCYWCRAKVRNCAGHCHEFIRRWLESEVDT